MKIYSDASISEFFKTVTKDKSTGFLNEWNANRNKRERIYISYDSTNKNCQAGDIELAEFGHAKTDNGCGYSFVIMAKGMSSFISDVILENKGTFENKRSCDMNAFGVYGKTIQRVLFEGDTKKRYVHIYHSISKEADEREVFENVWSLFPEEKTTVTEREISLCGYFVIITSERMSAKEALRLYKSRDASEKLFAADKSFLGNKSMRVHTNEGIEGKIFTQFIALIIRNKIYTSLQETGELYEKKQNYMTVPAAIKELEKIEMTRQTDNIYCPTAHCRRRKPQIKFGEFSSCTAD